MRGGRLIDIPYDSSPALIFTFRQTKALVAGQYNFTGTGSLVKSAFTPSRPINPNVLYLFRTMSFAMDIAETDYQGAISTCPEFSAYVQSDGAAPAFREPVVLAKYFDNLPYNLAIMGSALHDTAYPGASASPVAQTTLHNRLLGCVTGILNQTPALIGKVSVTAIVMLSAQEVVDTDFINCFKKNEGHAQGLAGKVYQ